MREFLARNQVTHTFNDVRKRPIPPEEALAIVRRHKRAIAKRGANVVEIDPARASDEEILKYFLGREGFLRAPTVSVGDTIIAGYDAGTFEKLVG